MRWLLLLVAVVVVTGIAVWVVSPRFAIDTPSLVDDWAAIARSPEQMSQVIRFGNPEEQRFRPGWIAWNYVQWHTLDAPRGLVGPNFWNIARILVLVAGLSLMTALALPRARGVSASILYAALAVMPALLVVTVQKFAVDLARFGPQEPLLLGGMTLGGALLVLCARSVLDTTRRLRRWRTAMLAVAGGTFWILGVYQKETALAALPLIAAVLFAGRARLGGWRRLSSTRRAALASLAAIVVLPLVHIAIQSLLIVNRGDLVYDARVNEGRTAFRGVLQLYDWAHEVLPSAASACVLAAVVLTVLSALLRRGIDVLAVGALASGALALGFAGQAGVVATRYYIPAYALFAVALSLSLARFPRLVQAAGVLVIVAVFLPPTAARQEVDLWVEEEQKGGALVRGAADFEDAGCVVAVAGLDVEAAQALPALVGVEARRLEAPGTCGDGGTYFVVGDSGEGRALARTCMAGGLERLVDGGETAHLYRCAQLRAKPVRDPLLGLVAPERLVTLRRLRVPAYQ